MYNYSLEITCLFMRMIYVTQITSDFSDVTSQNSILPSLSHAGKILTNNPEVFYMIVFATSSHHVLHCANILHQHKAAYFSTVNIAQTFEAYRKWC
jgi:hypothetical protein